MTEWMYIAKETAKPVIVFLGACGVVFLIGYTIDLCLKDLAGKR
jgi:hypothetical protein